MKIKIILLLLFLLVDVITCTKKKSRNPWSWSKPLGSWPRDGVWSHSFYFLADAFPGWGCYRIEADLCTAWRRTGMGLVATVPSTGNPGILSILTTPQVTHTWSGFSVLLHRGWEPAPVHRAKSVNLLYLNNGHSVLVYSNFFAVYLP